MFISCRHLILAATLGLALLIPVSAATAAPPPGPRLAVVKLRQPEWTQLLTVDPYGGAQESLYALSQSKAPRAVYPWSAPSWSPDGTQIAFTVLNEVLPEFGKTGTSLALISAGGGPLRAIPNTANGFEPVFSPDGHTIAFARQRELDVPDGDHHFESVSIWLATWRPGNRGL